MVERAVIESFECFELSTELLRERLQSGGASRELAAAQDELARLREALALVGSSESLGEARKHANAALADRCVGS